MTTYYVSTTGSDDAVGNAGSPWRTINRAMNEPLQPGDEVVVRPGTYNEAVYFARGGAEGNNIILRSEVPGEALIRSPESAWNAVHIFADHVTIDGFDIKGSGGGDGIEANHVHHIEILNNIVHGNAESGIQTNWSEFITIDGNVTYGNAWNGYFSGISVYQMRNITGDTETEGFRTIIRNNVSYDNVTKNGEHVDGNGIIIDDFQSTHTEGYPNYTYPTLVENNLVYSNGGKGIAVHWSDNVTVRNNTAWHNNLDLNNPGTWRGELSNQDSSDNVWINNIAVADPSIHPDNTAIGFYGDNNNVEWTNNLSFNGREGDASLRLDGGNAAPRASDGNLLGVDPGFVNAPEDFRLESGSPARNAGESGAGLGANLWDASLGDEGAGDAGSEDRADPVANDAEGYTVGFQDTLTIPSDSLLADDTGVSVVSVDDAKGGTVVLDDNGSIVFEPEAGYSGPASFSYTVSDDEGGTASATVSLTVGQPDETFSLFDASAVPERESYPDEEPVELGLKFQADVDGVITAIRFFRGPGNDGPHPVTLRAGDGQILGTGQATGSGTGWQEVILDKPVAFSAGDIGIASYHAPQGKYSVSKNYFTESIDRGPISTSQDAGVYAYGRAGSFPESAYQGNNYWVDVVFVQTETPVSNDENLDASAFSASGAMTLENDSDLEPAVKDSGNDTQPLASEVPVEAEEFEFDFSTEPKQRGDAKKENSGRGHEHPKESGSAEPDSFDMNGTYDDSSVKGDEASSYEDQWLALANKVKAERGTMSDEDVRDIELLLADNNLQVSDQALNEFLLLA